MLMVHKVQLAPRGQQAMQGPTELLDLPGRPVLTARPDLLALRGPPEPPVPPALRDPQDHPVGHRAQRDQPARKALKA